MAEEYALRFGPAFPGGMFWLSAESYERDLRIVADTLGAAGSSAERLLSGIARLVTWPSLWVFDGVPQDFAQAGLLRAPNPLGATLWTTRTLAYESLAVAVRLGPLSAEEGLEMLTARRPARDALEERAARGIVEDLGGHPALTAAGVAQVER